MDLTPDQRKQLHAAIIAAFPTWGDLRLLTDLELGMNLATLSAEQNINLAALDLIYWALKEGRLAALIEAMCAARPDNTAVQACRELLATLKQPTSTLDSSPSTALSPLQARTSKVTLTLLSARVTIKQISLGSEYNPGDRSGLRYNGLLRVQPLDQTRLILNQTSYVELALTMGMGRARWKDAMRWRVYNGSTGSYNQSLEIADTSEIEFRLPGEKEFESARRVQEYSPTMTVVVFVQGSGESAAITANLPYYSTNYTRARAEVVWQLGYPPD